jgi:hypothetical protein
MKASRAHKMRTGAFASISPTFEKRALLPFLAYRESSRKKRGPEELRFDARRPATSGVGK